MCEVELLGDGKFTLRQQKFKVSEQLKTGKATDLFDYIAESVANFLETMDQEKLRGEELYLGFTFSFPVEQTALDRGKLITWTKVCVRFLCLASVARTPAQSLTVAPPALHVISQGFEATGAIGQDVVHLLQDALDRRQVPVRCSALVNDTVGTLLSRAYQSGAALVGGIFGTGTNGAYVEKLSAITKKLPSQLEFEFMIINTECK